MKLYTKRGDAGLTDLIGGTQVGKDHLRVQAYGSIDELNATLGLSLANCPNDAIKAPLITAQHRLFDLGAQLATPPADPPPPQPKPRITAEHVRQVETQIDAISALLTPLARFILPGGCELAARLHLARTVCRRAERDAVALAQADRVDPQALIYLNRMSDLLFALARLANQEAGCGDVPWEQATEPGNV